MNWCQRLVSKLRCGSSPLAYCLVELRGLEPLTPCLQSTRRQTSTSSDVRFVVN
jgi:hypothetical protein